MLNRFRFQLTISHLMLATFAVAAFFALLAPLLVPLLSPPFDPEVTFHSTILQDAEIADGIQSPIGIVQIKNRGISSIWYEGRTGRVTSFFSASGPNRRNAFGYVTVDFTARWTELKPGNTAYARFPIGSASDQVHFELELQDRRGRSAWRSNGQIQDVSVGFGTKVSDK